MSCLLNGEWLRYIDGRNGFVDETVGSKGPVHCPERPGSDVHEDVRWMGSERQRISTMSDTEDKIRAKAHELWLAEGQPEGKADEHWQAAEAIVRTEAEKKATRKPRAPKEPAAKAAAPKKAAAKTTAKTAEKKEAAPKRVAKKPDLKVVSDKDAAA
jgi:hypothetical protein